MPLPEIENTPPKTIDEIAGIHSGKSEGIVSVVERARQCLRVHASAGRCRPVKLNDERVVRVHKLNAEGFDAAHAQTRVVGRQRECALAGCRIDRQRGRSRQDGVGGRLEVTCSPKPSL